MSDGAIKQPPRSATWPPRVALSDMTGTVGVLPTRSGTIRLPVDGPATCKSQHSAATRLRHHTYWDETLRKWHLRICSRSLTPSEKERMVKA